MMIWVVFCLWDLQSHTGGISCKRPSNLGKECNRTPDTAWTPRTPLDITKSLRADSKATHQLLQWDIYYSCACWLIRRAIFCWPCAFFFTYLSTHTKAESKISNDRKPTRNWLFRPKSQKGEKDLSFTFFLFSSFYPRNSFFFRLGGMIFNGYAEKAISVNGNPLEIEEKLPFAIKGHICGYGEI